MNKLMGMVVLVIVSILLCSCNKYPPKKNHPQSYIQINKRGEDGNTLLCYAVAGNIKKLTQLLSSFPKDVKLHSIPVDRNRKHELVKLLLEYGADPNIANYSNWRALHYACSNGDVEVVKLLINAGAKLNLTEHGGSTPLHIACRAGNEKVVKVLIGAGANIGAEDEGGNTPLHMACIKDNHKIVKILILAGAFIQVRNKDGATPLHYTSQHWVGGKSKKLLIDAGANVDSLNRSGKTPAECFKALMEPPLRGISEFP